MVALDTQLPNACFGRQASQWLRWTLSDPIHETDRPAEIPVGLNTHPQKVTPIQVALSSIPPRSVGNLRDDLSLLVDFQQ